ncbi:MAG: outer membrane beta-barrel protein [Marinoscillum sp.]
MKFGAYLDSYYTYDFNQPNNNQRPYVTQYDRHNEFSINHAWINGAYESEKIRASLAIQTGTYPANNYGAEPIWAQMIYEGFAGYRITKNGWLDIGVFGGHFGYESALSIDRELLSPALATEYTPYYQSGIRYTHDLSDNTQLRAVVVNGWQNIRETNDYKSVGLALDHQMSDKVFLSYGNYYGVDRSALGTNVWRFHNNGIISFSPSNELKLTGIIDWTLQEAGSGSQSVVFLTTIASYKMSDKWSINARYEYVKDEDEVLINGFGPSYNQSIVSLALGYHPSAHVSFKIEPKLYAGNSDYSANANSAFVLHSGVAVRLQ